MTEACADRHDDIVDALMGNLSDERKAEFEAHIRSCTGCADEVRELSSVASQLRGAEVDVDAISRFDAPPAGLGVRVTQAVEEARTEDSTVVSLESRRPRARRIALAAVAAAAVLVIVAVAALGPSNPATSPEQVALAAKETAPGATATAELRPQSYGTTIDLKVGGLDDGTVYALWMADASGTRSPAGTFVAGHDGRATLDTSTALARDKAVKIWVTDPNDTTVLAAPLT